MVSLLKTHWFGMAILLAASGCSKLPFWGEKPQKPGVIKLTPSSDGCAEPIQILKGNESQSAQAMECWAKEIDHAWDQVNGQTPNALSENELRALLNKRVVKLSGDVELDLSRIRAVKRLLGLGENLTRDQTRSWLGWTKSRRAEIRKAYQQWIAPVGEQVVRYSDLKDASDLAAAFLSRVGWRLSDDSITQDLKSLSLSVTPEWIKVANGSAHWICPLSGDPSTVSSAELGQCLIRLGNEFAVGASWFEFLLNPVGQKFDPTPKLDALNRLGPVVDRWFSQDLLRPLKTKLWVDLSQSLGAPAPRDFIESLKWIRKFKGKSTEEELHPTAVPRLFRIFANSQRPLIQEMPRFLSCPEWSECVLRDPESVAQQSASVQSALKIWNIRIGQSAVPLTGKRFAELMFFQSAADEVVQAFDEDGDGILRVDSNNPNDEVVQLVKFLVDSLGHLERFYDRLKSRLEGKPVEPLGTSSDSSPLTSSGWDPKGFARLITLSSDLLVFREKANREWYDGILSNLTNDFPESTLAMDRLALAAVVANATALSDFKKDYLSRVKGRNVRDGLPQFLSANFPRTWASCQEFKSGDLCLQALSKMVTDPNDVETVAILSIGLEGLVDTCDRNGDGVLSWDVLDGNDELDCGFVKVRSLVTRLFESKILMPNDPEGAKRVKFLLDLLNSIFVTRMFGKMSMIRGEKGDPLFNLPVFYIGKSASLGSMYGLLYDILR